MWRHRNAGCRRSRQTCRRADRCRPHWCPAPLPSRPSRGSPRNWPDRQDIDNRSETAAWHPDVRPRIPDIRYPPDAETVARPRVRQCAGTLPALPSARAFPNATALRRAARGRAEGCNRPDSASTNLPPHPAGSIHPAPHGFCAGWQFLLKPDRQARPVHPFFRSTSCPSQDR
ncbi:MAG: hypothetical protein ACD_54C00811G0001 [uncultured bacterium]|nr:MAG: hypothetical protein ACD_54C00811G0001 [uncultured bacterium]